MKIIVNNSSMIPIYTQIVEQIKSQIAAGKLNENDPLPSVRTLSGELKISALTVKKAYDELESEGFVVTVHGKGTYVSGGNSEYIRENQIKEIETDLQKVIDKANFYNISKEELFEIWEVLTEE
ncbi:MAG: GntR family transcriptional regulator [Lachnospiraceae bacterium]|nr:GntR family transcriptional regulator [Lachnospiraceae bacterium]